MREDLCVRRARDVEYGGPVALPGLGPGSTTRVGCALPLRASWFVYLPCVHPSPAAVESDRVYDLDADQVEEDAAADESEDDEEFMPRASGARRGGVSAAVIDYDAPFERVVIAKDDATMAALQATVMENVCGAGCAGACARTCVCVCLCVCDGGMVMCPTWL